MCTYRDICCYDGFDLWAHSCAAFQFYTVCMSFFHQTSCIHNCIIDRCLIRHKRHICQNKSIFCPSADRCCVGDHIFHRNRQCILIAKHGIAKGIPDQQDLNAGFIHEFSHGIIIAGEHCDLLTIIFLLL